MKYLAKLDNNNHVQTIYLPSQLTDTNGYVSFEVPDVWQQLFMQDWTNFYIKSDGSLDFDNNKNTQTQQYISKLQTANDAQSKLNAQMIQQVAMLQIDVKKIKGA